MPRFADRRGAPERGDYIGRVPNDSSTSSVPVHRVVLRPAAPEDVAAVGDLTVRAYVHSGYVAADDEYVSQLRAADDRLRGAELWVATVGDTVSATVTFCPPGSVYRKLATPLEAELRMLAVDPSARRRGLATALVSRCLQRCTELGLDGLVLCTLDQMAPALGLYTSLGFERDPDLDWEPAPGVRLVGFRAVVPAAQVASSTGVEGPDRLRE
jgi:ribosomal protein S18 acetylase RimI-like enzyme